MVILNQKIIVHIIDNLTQITQIFFKLEIYISNHKINLI